jgi:hypothetical protein
MTTKELLLQSIQSWPDDISWDDAIDRIQFIRKIERAERDIEAGRVYSQEEIEQMYPLADGDEEDQVDGRGAA